jgi:hypothetical protein
MSVPFGRFVVSVNRNKSDLWLNSDLKLWTAPKVIIESDPCQFLLDLAKLVMQDSVFTPGKWNLWLDECSERERKKIEENEVREVNFVTKNRRFFSAYFLKAYPFRKWRRRSNRNL